MSVCRFTDFFWLYCVTAVTPFIERSEGWSLRSVGVLDQSQQECPLNAVFFAEIQIHCKLFSSSPRGKPLLLLWEIGSRHVWLSSSACDHCCAYQLICIMKISTYTTGARTEMTRQLGSCTVKKRELRVVTWYMGSGLNA